MDQPITRILEMEAIPYHSERYHLGMMPLMSRAMVATIPASRYSIFDHPVGEACNPVGKVSHCIPVHSTANSHSYTKYDSNLERTLLFSTMD